MRADPARRTILSIGLLALLLAANISPTAIATTPPIPQNPSPGSPDPNNPYWVSSTTPTLSWSASPGAATYLLNMRRMSDGVLFISERNLGNVLSYTMPAGDLAPDITYKWAVEAGDGSGGNSVQSTPVYIHTPPQNQPPGTAATPSGPTSVNTGTSYTYATSATDPNGDPVRYIFDFGDGSSFCATSYVPSGSSDSCTHTWTQGSSGSCVRAYAQDTNGAQSQFWSPCLTVSVNSPPTCSITSPSSQITIPVNQRQTFQAHCTDVEGQWYAAAWAADDFGASSQYYSGGTSPTWDIQQSYTWTSTGPKTVGMGVIDHAGGQSTSIYWNVNVQGPPRANLVAQAPRFSPDPPQRGTGVAITCPYSNAGTTSAPGGFDVRISVDSTTLTATGSALSAGASDSRALTFGSFAAGQHTVTCQLNANGVVDEDASDSSATITKTWNGPTLAISGGSSVTGNDIAPGTSVRDAITLTGSGPAPGGSVSFYLCSPAQSTSGGCASGGTQIGSAVTVSGGAATSSATSAPRASGTYCWRAEYSGDASYDPVTLTNTGSQCFTVVTPPVQYATTNAKYEGAIVDVIAFPTHDTYGLTKDAPSMGTSHDAANGDLVYSLDMGELANRVHIQGDDADYWFHMGVTVESSVVVDGNGQYATPGDEICTHPDFFPVFDVKVNGHLVGSVTGHDQSPCLDDGPRMFNLFPTDPNGNYLVFSVRRDYVQPNANEIRLVAHPTPFTNPNGGPPSQSWRIKVAWSQMELVAPPVMIDHGWSSNFDPATSRVDWEPTLGKNIAANAKMTLGQDPWAWSSRWTPAAACRGGVSAEAGLPPAICLNDYDPKQDLRNDALAIASATEAQFSAMGHYDGKGWIHGHSAGGLAARYFLEVKHGDARFSKIAMDATPNLGTPGGDYYTEGCDDYNMPHPVRCSLVKDATNSWFAGNWDWRTYQDQSGAPLGSGDSVTECYPRAGCSEIPRLLAWKDWSDPTIQAYAPSSHRGSIGVRDHRGEFELKPWGTANPFLNEMLNPAFPKDDVEYFTVGGVCNTGVACGWVTSEIIPDSDEAVPVSSLTMNGCLPIARVDQTPHEEIPEKDRTGEAIAWFFLGLSPNSGAWHDPRAPYHPPHTPACTFPGPASHVAPVVRGAPAALATAAAEIPTDWRRATMLRPQSDTRTAIGGDLPGDLSLSIPAGSVSLLRTEGGSDRLSLMLRPPSGDPLPFPPPPGTGIGSDILDASDQDGQATVFVVDLSSFSSGEWGLDVQATNASQRSNLTLEISPTSAVTVVALPAEGRALPDTVTRIFAKADESGSPASGIDIKATLPWENATITLLDDGAGPDAVAADGIYSAEFLTPNDPAFYALPIVAARPGIPQLYATIPLLVAARPDLAITSVRGEPAGAWGGDAVTILAVVTSLGERLTKGDVKVEFYDGDTDVGTPLIGVVDLPSPPELGSSLAVGLNTTTPFFTSHVTARVVDDDLDLDPTNDLLTATLPFVPTPKTVMHAYGEIGDNGWFLTPSRFTLGPFDGSDRPATPQTPLFFGIDGGQGRYQSPGLFDACCLYNGEHTITFSYHDAQGNVEPTRTEHIAVDTDWPRIDITQPQQGTFNFANLHVNNPQGDTIILGPTIVHVDASDETSGVDRVEFYVNGALQWTSRTAPYTFPWDPPVDPIPQKQLEARVYDRAGHRMSSWINAIVVGSRASTDVVALNATGDATGSRGAIAPNGNATTTSNDCQAPLVPCVSECQQGGTNEIAPAASGSGNASGSQAVSGTGSAQGGYAVSGTGPACGTVAASAAGPVDGGVTFSVFGPAHGAAPISVFNDSTGTAATSGTGNATGAAALSGSGNASGIVAVSLLGNATCQEILPGLCIAVSGTGAATGAQPFGVAGSCNGGACNDIEPTSDARSNSIAVSGTGDSSGPVAVSALGNATGDEAIAGQGNATGVFAAISALGPANATSPEAGAAASGGGNATSQGQLAGAAASGTGDATSSGQAAGAAVAVLGSARTPTTLAGVAVSVLGPADSNAQLVGATASILGPAHGGNAVSGTGSATCTGVDCSAVSLTGDANSTCENLVDTGGWGCFAVSGTGNASCTEASGPHGCKTFRAADQSGSLLDVSATRPLACQPAQEDPARPTCLYKEGADSISAGEFALCAVQADHNVRCEDRDDSIMTYDGGNASQVSAGQGHACILLADHNVECRGDNGYGQAAPRELHDVARVAAGDYFTCFVLLDGTAPCQGPEWWGDLSPYHGNDVADVALGSYRICYLLTNASARCFMRGSSEATIDHAAHDVTAISAGQAYACFLLRTGNVACDGQDPSGDSASYSGGDAVAIAAGGYHVCILVLTGDVTCQGDNWYGESSNYTGHDAIAITTTYSYTCFLLVGGRVHCQGGLQHRDEISIVPSTALPPPPPAANVPIPPPPRLPSSDDITNATGAGGATLNALLQNASGAINGTAPIVNDTQQTLNDTGKLVDDGKRVVADIVALANDARGLLPTTPSGESVACSSVTPEQACGPYQGQWQVFGNDACTGQSGAGRPSAIPGFFLLMPAVFHSDRPRLPSVHDPSGPFMGPLQRPVSEQIAIVNGALGGEDAFLAETYPARTTPDLCGSASPHALVDR